MGEKTEKASPKKLRDAKKKGQLARSQDFGSAFTFIISIWVTLSSVEFLYGYLGGFVIAAFKAVGQRDLETTISVFFIQSFMVIFLASIPIMAATTLMGMLATFISVGPCFAPEVFKPDIKKFNPIDNIKGKFKMKTLVELIKQIVKISVAGYICYGVIMESLPILAKTVSLPVSASMVIFATFLKKVIIQVGLFFIVIAIADLLYQKHAFAKEMMMEKFEVKQEYKNSEGDPQVKGKRKQVAQEIAYSEGPGAGVKRSQAVVTNPVHLAIAIGYERELDPAPFILAMGREHNAAQIIKYAEEYGIPVLRNIPLAHRLWEEGHLYEYVPEDTYEPLAEILRWIASLKTGDELESLKE